MVCMLYIYLYLFIHTPSLFCVQLYYFASLSSSYIIAIDCSGTGMGVAVGAVMGGFIGGVLLTAVIASVVAVAMLYMCRAKSADTAISK